MIAKGDYIISYGSPVWYAACARAAGKQESDCAVGAHVGAKARIPNKPAPRLSGCQTYELEISLTVV